MRALTFEVNQGGSHVQQRNKHGCQYEQKEKIIIGDDRRARGVSGAGFPLFDLPPPQNYKGQAVF